VVRRGKPFICQSVEEKTIHVTKDNSEITVLQIPSPNTPPPSLHFIYSTENSHCVGRVGSRYVGIRLSALEIINTLGFYRGEVQLAS
jgi:hypothetical protein